MINPAPRSRGRPRDDRLRAQRRQHILAAATGLFAKHGFRGLDVQLVADRLGVGKGTVYRYFPSKRELFLAAVDHGMNRLVAHLDHAMLEHSDTLEQMKAAVRAYLEFFTENPDLVELLIQERAEFRDREKPTYFLHRERNVGRWQEMLRGLIIEGRVRDVPPGRITEVVGDLLYGAMFTNYFARRNIPPERQAADINDIALYGILTDQERRRNHEA